MRLLPKSFVADGRTREPLSLTHASTPLPYGTLPEPFLPVKFMTRPCIQEVIVGWIGMITVVSN